MENIKFKGEVPKETFEAICIENQKLPNGQLGVTEGKKYIVKQSQFTNFYELVNDLGEIDTYLKRRFKVIPKLTEKIKARCKDKESGNLTFGKEYGVLGKWQEDNNQMKPYGPYWVCLIIDDTGNKSVEPCCIFEEVKEDNLIVECIDSKDKESGLTINKKYPVIKVKSKGYLIKNDNDEIEEYNSFRFKLVPKEKEQKEYTLSEVFEEKEGTEFKNTESNCYVKLVKIDGIKSLVTINKEDNYHKWNKEMVAPINEVWLNLRFIKVEEQKTVSTVEAFKALEEGKTIMSILSNNQYKEYDKDIFASTIGCNEFHKCELIYTNEIGGKWLITE